MPRLAILLTLVVAALSSCAIPIPAAVTANAPSAVAATAPEATPRPGNATATPQSLLLAPAELPAGFRADPSALTAALPGPGLQNAEITYVRGSDATFQRLYLRVSRFVLPFLATREFTQEQGDIGRSSTALPAGTAKVGVATLAYTVASGAGTSATASVGILFRERNYLASVVLTGASGKVHLSEMLPIARSEAERIGAA